MAVNFNPTLPSYQFVAKSTTPPSPAPSQPSLESSVQLRSDGVTLSYQAPPEAPASPSAPPAAPTQQPPQRQGLLYSLGEGHLGAPVYHSNQTGGLVQFENFGEAQAVAVRNPLNSYGLSMTAMPAFSGVQEMVTRYFAADEFKVLNSGKYHNADHPVAVAESAMALARGLGIEPERAKFLGQVALLHDADERIQSNSGEVKTGTPARAQVTLAWMDKNQQGLQERMGWSPEQFVEAKALIARTEFPFDDKPKAAMGTRYDGQSPVQVYQDLLEQLPESRRAPIMKEGLALRFADQAGFYGGEFPMALESVKGLAEELKSVGVQTTLAGSIAFTPTFLDGVGKDTQFDQAIAERLQLTQTELPDRDQMLQAWPASMRANFHSNARKFGELGALLKGLSPEQVEQKLPGCLEAVELASRLSANRGDSN